MADSTCLAAAPAAPTTWPERWKQEKRQRYAVRRELLQGIETRTLAAATSLVERESAQPFGRRGVAAQIVCQSALALGKVWQGKGTLPGRAAAFRVLGDQAKAEGLSVGTAVGAVESGVREAIAVVRRDIGEAVWNDRRNAVLRTLEAEAETFTVAVTEQLRLGMSGTLRSAESKASVLCRLLDGRIADDEIGAAAASVGLDVSREHGVVLLVHALGRTREVEAAAQEAGTTIYGAVDVGPSTALPVSRCLVFPVMTHGRWIEARTHLHEIASKHGVLAIAPIAAPTLSRLAETYQATARDLRRIVKGCGYTSGIIDPGCVGPACAAEGTSPSPAEPEPVVALVPSPA